MSYDKIKIADEKVILDETGFTIGAIPIVGLLLPCIIDKKLFEFDFIYGGTGDQNHTLKIAPTEI